MLKTKLNLLIVALLSLTLVGCENRIPVPYMVGCEQFEPIELKTLDFKFEPIHQADVLHTDELDKNKSVVYRNMSDTGLGNHSYKHASIGSTDLFIELYYLYGKVINDILSHNDRVEEYKKKKELEENNVKTLK